MKERIEDIRTYLHDTVDEMEIENRVQEEQWKLKRPFLKM